MKVTGVALVIMVLFTMTCANGDQDALLNPRTGRLMAPTHHGTYLDPGTGRLMIPTHNGTYLDPQTGRLLTPTNQGYYQQPDMGPVMAPTYDRNFLDPHGRETRNPDGMVPRE